MFRQSRVDQTTLSLHGFPQLFNLGFFRYSALALRILLWVLLASLIVFALATSFGIVHERNKALRVAHANAEEAVRLRLTVLGSSLWQYDSAGMNALLRGLVQSGSIVRAELLDNGKTIADINRPGFKESVDDVWILPVLAPEGKEEIGTLRISESYAEVSAQIAESMKILAMTDLIKIIGLSAILFVIVYRKIARHLRKLAEDVTNLGPAAKGTPGGESISIARKKIGSYHDELDILVEAVNRFVGDRNDEIVRRSAAEANLHERVSEIEATLGAISDGVLALDSQRRIGYVNSAACALLQALPEEISGKKIDEILHLIDPATGSDLSGFFESILMEGNTAPIRLEVSIRISSDHMFDARISAAPVRDSIAISMIFVFTDISEEVSNHRKIEFQAFHDPLTRLGNRAMLAKILPRDIGLAQSDSSQVAVLCIDLDNFKNINDTLGHLLGDSMLKFLAIRFEAVIAGTGWVTRHGGDEFIVVLPNISSVESAIALTEKLMATIAEPFIIEGHEGNVLRITSSIGISMCPNHGTDVGKLISNADLAMYAAKRHGKNTFRVFEEEMLQSSMARLHLENGLRVALQERQFSLVFQPKVNLSSGRVDSAEALLRWKSPQAGVISPANFIPVAEETGLIIEIGAWVLGEALAAAYRLRAELGYNVALAVNVSPVQFRSDALMSTLRQLRETSPDMSDLIEIELTETALAGDNEDIVSKLDALKNLGLKVAIDDFGTGYSSLAYLKNFPIDILKIDQAFIRDLSVNQKDKAIVTSIVQLGKSLGFKTVAEGVEEKEHVEILSELGCDYAQGYWFARPVPEHELAGKIRAIEVLAKDYFLH